MQQPLLDHQQHTQQLLQLFQLHLLSNSQQVEGIRQFFQLEMEVGHLSRIEVQRMTRFDTFGPEIHFCTYVRICYCYIRGRN